MPFELLQYGFAQRALVAGTILAVVLPPVGLFLVVRRYALFSDALAHVGLAGASLAALIGVSPLLGALATSLGTGVVLEELRRTSRLNGDALLALFLSGSLALAVTVASFAPGGRGTFSALLFGSITTVTSFDVVAMLLAAATIGLVLRICWRRFFFLALDDELAQASGLPVRSLSLVLTVMAAVLTALALPVVGALLVGALMIVPVLAAMQLRLNFTRTALWSVAFSLLATWSGLALSAAYDLPPGAVTVLCAIVAFSIARGVASIQSRLRTDR